MAAAPTVPVTETDDEKRKLELEKLRLERQALARNNSWQGIALEWLKALAVPAAIAGVVVTFLNAGNQLAASRVSSDDQRFSAAVSLLSEKEAQKRLAGLTGLSLFLSPSYGNRHAAAVRYLVGALAIDQEPVIRVAILQTLANLDADTTDQLALRSVGNLARAGDIAEFSDAVRKLETIFYGLQQTIEEFQMSEAMKLEGLSARAAPDSCTASSVGCQLVFSTPDSTTASNSGPDRRQLVSLLVEYSEALREVANARNATDMSAAFAHTKDSLVGIATAISQSGSTDTSDSLSQPAQAIVLPPSINLVVSDETRFAALRKVTTATEPVFAELASTFLALANTASQVSVLEADEAFRAARSAYRTSPREKLAEFKKAAAVYDAALRADPTVALNSLITAHHRLTESLSQPNDFLAVATDLKRIAGRIGREPDFARQIEAAAAEVIAL